MLNSDYTFFQKYKSCKDLTQVVYEKENRPEANYQHEMLCKLIEEFQSEYGVLNLTRDEYATYMNDNDTTDTQLKTYQDQNAIGDVVSKQTREEQFEELYIQN